MSDITETIKQVLDPATRQALGMAKHYLDEAALEFNRNISSDDPGQWAGRSLKEKLKLAQEKITVARDRAGDDEAVTNLAAYLDASCNALLGRGVLLLDKPKEAIEYLEKAVLIVVNDPDLYRSLQAAYQRLGNKDKALEYAETALSLDSENYALAAEIEALKKQGAFSTFLGSKAGGQTIDAAGTVAKGALKGTVVVAKGFGVVGGFMLKKMFGVKL